MITTLIIRYRLARVAVHLLAYVNHREPWARARAGIAREFNFKRKYQIAGRSQH